MSNSLVTKSAPIVALYCWLNFLCTYLDKQSRIIQVPKTKKQFIPYEIKAADIYVKDTDSLEMSFPHWKPSNYIHKNQKRRERLFGEKENRKLNYPLSPRTMTLSRILLIETSIMVTRGGKNVNTVIFSILKNLLQMELTEVERKGGDLWNSN